MPEFFDTHAHYDHERFERGRHGLIGSMPKRGITLILVPGCDLESSRAAVGLTKHHRHVYAAAGTHPHEAAGFDDRQAAALRRLYSNPKVVAVGEIGLDYRYDHSPRDVQRACFERQLELAARLRLPVIVHEREAYEDTINILSGYNVRAVFHCYSGSAEAAKRIINMGHYISFTGIITFPKVRNALETAAWVPADRFMLETDAPYMTPVPHRGRRNDSSYLPYIARAIAAVRKVNPYEIAEQTYRNGTEFFGITPEQIPGAGTEYSAYREKQVKETKI
ncbi:MAG: TatD family hydrolase [Oscillospiraceae bacterium]|nr:TatD family hydrolase [Oscillospiraceae bacterium]